MHIDFNILVILMLNIGLALAFACYGNRLLSYERVANIAQSRSTGSVSGLQVALRVPRPTRRHSIPRIRVKTDSSGDEPPQMIYST